MTATAAAEGAAARARGGAAEASGSGADSSADSKSQQPPQQQQRMELAWVCQTCERECWPIRSESRCLCGHRLKEHAAAAAGARRACKNARCECAAFFFIVAEGAWTLRCRCKHRAAEHAARPPHACGRCKGAAACGGFDSPWVCNCDHAWAQHAQVEVARAAVPLAQRLGGPGLGAESSSGVSSSGVSGGSSGSGGGSGGGGSGSGIGSSSGSGSSKGAQPTAAAAAAMAAVAAAAAEEIERWSLVQRGRE